MAFQFYTCSVCVVTSAICLLQQKVPLVNLDNMLAQIIAMNIIPNKTTNETNVPLFNVAI